MNNLTVGIGADISNLQAGIAQATSSLSGFVSTANSRLESFGSNIQGIGSKLLGLSIPLGLLGKQALENGGGLESLKMGLKSIEEQQYGVGKSAEYATARYNEYVQLAKLPGIGLKEAIAMSIGLRSVGFSADDAKREILAFGNALALVGKGKNELNGVALQIQQLSGKTSGFGADLRVIKEYAPQVGGALMAAFGTIDTEAIAKTGVTGKQVIEKITTELEKLPKAGAGLKNAMENVADSIFITTGRIGEALNKSLGLTTIFDKIGSSLSGLATAFENLSPFAQKFIGITAGLLVIVPPLLIGVGALVPVFGLLTTGITAILSPIGLVAAGLAGLAYVVATNWAEVKGFLTETGIWDGLSLIVQNTFGVIKGAFTFTVGVIKSIWKDGLEIIHNDTFGIFGVITGVISGALQVIGGVIGVFSNLLQGNWSGLWTSLKNIMKGSFNAIISIAEGFVVLIVGAFQKVFEFFGADKIVSQFKQATDSIKKQFEGFKYKVELDKVENTTKNSKEVKADGTLPTPPKKDKPLTDEQLKAQEKAKKDTEDLLIKLAQFKADIIEDEVKKAIEGETAKYEKEKNSIERTKANVQVKHATLLALEASHQKAISDIKAEAQKKESGFIINSVTNQTVKERALEQLSFQDKMKNIPKIIQGKVNQNKAIELLEIEHQAKMREIESKGGVSPLKSNLTKTGGIGAKNTDGSDAFGQFQGFKTGLNLTNPLESLTNRMNASLPKMQAVIGKNVGLLMDLKNGINSSLQGAASSAFSGLGNVFGAMIAGTAGIGDAGKAIMGVIGGVFGQMGEQFTQAGVALLLLEPLIKNPFTSGFGMIAAGVALSALSGAISSTVSSGGTSGGGSSSYTQNYSSGSSSFGGGGSFGSGGNREQVFTINLTGKLVADGNDMAATYDRTIKQKARTYGGK